MPETHFPWLELCVLIPLVGAIYVAALRDRVDARRAALWFNGITLALTLGAWLDFQSLHIHAAHDRWDLLHQLTGRDVLTLDELSAPLLSLAALLHLLTSIATLRTKMRRFSFAWSLFSESILLATLGCHQRWDMIGLLALGTVPPLIELRNRRKPVRIYVIHMAMFIGLLVIGQAWLDRVPATDAARLAPAALLTAAVLIRSGIAPAHCWMIDLFENASFGTALLFVTPMLGAYAAVHLVLPVAPDWALRSVATLSLLTTVYAAGMALIQRDSRRFFCYLFLSHSALVLVGLEMVTPISLTGALSLWLSIGLAMTGFGLTLRSMEARLGRVSLHECHGMQAHTPMLAHLFLLTGLASVGFPGTFGFAATELLVDGAVQVYALRGVLVVLAAALNGIAVLQAFFRVFGGKRHMTSISLANRPAETWAVLVMAALILGGGLWPQPGIASRYHAALSLIESRSKPGAATPAAHEHPTTRTPTSPAAGRHIAQNRISAQEPSHDVDTSH